MIVQTADILSSNLSGMGLIASCMGPNPVRGKRLFSWARNFEVIAHYWLVPEKDTYYKYEMFSTVSDFAKGKKICQTFGLIG